MSLQQNIVRALYPYGSIRRVLSGTGRGFRYRVENGMGLTYALGVCAAHSWLLLDRLRPSMTVFDIGANRGQMALLFAARVGSGGRVYSFEPVPELCRSLRDNIALNDLANVTTECAAVSDRAGEDEFWFSDDHVTQGKLVNVEKSSVMPAGHMLRVRTITLDDWFAARGVTPDVIKIDTEGAAAAVLRGARRLLQSASPRIYVELHGPEEQAGIRDELLRIGYVAETMEGQRIEDPTAGWFSPLWCYRPDARG